MAGLAVVVAAAVVLASIWLRSDTTSVRTAARPADRPAAGDRTGPAAYFNLEGRPPAAFPVTKLGLAFLALDEPLQRAIDALGPATSSGPDIFGTAHTWSLPARAQLTVSAWDDTSEIDGFYAHVPSASPARLGTFGGAVIGQSTLHDVVTAWGEGFTAATSPFDDYVVSYVECVGPYPVVIKFDQAAATDTEFAPSAGSSLWVEAVASVLIAYADEPAGSAGCSA